ncbi:MAG: hypothetical protein AB7V32_01930, partial [Candidatus Berkiella sp.]
RRMSPLQAKRSMGMHEKTSIQSSSTAAAAATHNSPLQAKRSMGMHEKTSIQSSSTAAAAATHNSPLQAKRSMGMQHGVKLIFISKRKLKFDLKK